MVGEMVQNSQIQHSFTFNDFSFVHVDIHSHLQHIFVHIQDQISIQHLCNSFNILYKR